jgi:hypothetical protein
VGTGGSVGSGDGVSGGAEVGMAVRVVGGTGGGLCASTGGREGTREHPDENTRTMRITMRIFFITEG